MPDFKLPLSGNVTQTINPWTVFLNPVGSQVGLFNINLGNSSDPAVEDQVISDVASYGKQLGRIGDVLTVLLRHIKLEHLSQDEKDAISGLKTMLREIASVKKKHDAKLVLEPD